MVYGISNKSQKNYDRVKRNYERIYRISGLSKDDSWEVAYKEDSARRFTLAQKDWEKGLTIHQISKKRGFPEEFLQRRLIYGEKD